MRLIKLLEEFYQQGEDKKDSKTEEAVYYSIRL